MLIPPTHKILTDAADLVDGHFTKGAFARRRPDGELCYCTIGALQAAVGFEFFGHQDDDLIPRPPSKPGTPSEAAYIKAVAAARAALIEHLGVLSLAGWSDAPERTAHDVVTALRGAAAVEQEKP